MSHPITREPITAQEAEHTLSRIAQETRAVTTLLDSLLTRAIPDGVAVSVSLRARTLLRDATEHLETAAQRLEGALN